MNKLKTEQKMTEWEQNCSKFIVLSYDISIVKMTLY